MSKEEFIELITSAAHSAGVVLTKDLFLEFCLEVQKFDCRRLMV